MLNETMKLRIALLKQLNGTRRKIHLAITRKDLVRTFVTNLNFRILYFIFSGWIYFLFFKVCVSAFVMLPCGRTGPLSSGGFASWSRQWLSLCRTCSSWLMRRPSPWYFPRGTSPCSASPPPLVESQFWLELTSLSTINATYLWALQLVNNLLIFLCFFIIMHVTRINAL